MTDHKKEIHILGVITARGGSKGIPGKNIKELGGKPLIQYSIDAADKSKLLTRCIVSTDDKNIARVAKECGAEVPFLRPEELATDTAGHLEVMQHAIREAEIIFGEKYDYVAILQPTSPFRTAEDLDGTIQKLIDTEADSAVAVVEVESNHPLQMKRLDGDRVLPFFEGEPEGQRRQDRPKAYKRSGAAYVMKRDLIMKENKLYGDHIVGYIVPKERSIDIDYPVDWIVTEYMLEELKKKGEL